MVESRSALFSGAGVVGTGAARLGKRSLLALLLAGAAMNAAPVGAVTYDLMGGTADRNDFIDPTTLTLADFVENGVFNLTIGSDLSFAGVLRDGAGTFTFNKLGDGNLLLTGANTYSGETGITGGSIVAGGDNVLSPNSRVRVGTTLELAGYDQTVRGFYQSGSILNSSGGTAVLTTNPGVNNSFSGSIVETAGNEVSLVKIGVGRQDLIGDNSYSGGTTLAGGTLGFGTNLSLGSGAVEITGAGAVLRTLGSNLVLANDIILTADGTIATAGLAPTLTGEISGAGSLTKINSGTLTITNTANSYTGGTFLQGGTLLLGGDNVLGAVAGSVAVGPASAIGTTGISALLSNNIVANAQLTFLAPTAQVLDIAGVVSGGGNIIIQGTSGTVILRSANTYTGTTQLVGGTLGVGNNLSLGGADRALLVGGAATLRAYNNVTINNNVRLAANLTVDTGGFDMTLADTVNNASAGQAGGLIKTGTGTLTLNAVNNYSGGTTLRGGVLSVGLNNRLGNASGGVTFDGGALRITGSTFSSTGRAFTLLSTGAIEVADAVNSFTVSSPITGAGGIAKTGPGALVLAGANTFAGGVTLESGTLVIDNDAALGAPGSALTTEAGTTVRFGSTPRTLTLANPITVNGSTTFATNGTSILDIVATGVVSTDGSVVTLNGNVGGAGPIVLSPFSDLTLNGANSFGGTFTVDRSVVRIGNAAAFGNASVVLANGALRNSSGAARTITNAVALTGTNTVGGADDLALASIAGTGGLIKVGANTLTLTGNSSYTGLTTINGGTLNLLGNLVGGGGATVNAGGTLTGSGTIFGNTTSNGGRIAPASTLIFDNLALDSASNLDFDLQTPGVVGSPNDLIVVNNNLVLDGTLNIAAAPGFTVGTYRIVNYGGLLTNNGLLIGGTPVGFTASNFTVDTSTANQVNLILSLGNTVYWDGTDMAGDGSVDGGSGTWNATNMNWTSETGAFNGSWGSGDGIFQTVGGTVAVADTLDFDMLSFRVTDYLLTDGGGSLRPSAIGEIETQDGVTTTINASIVGANGLAKTGNGTLVLGGANSFAGGLSVVAGTVQVTTSGALGAGSVTVNADTTVVVDAGFGNDILINGVGGTGGVFVTSAGNATLGGQITGTGSLTKTGFDQLTLSNAGNSYSGGTFVNAGTVRVGDSDGFGTGTIAIADGATIGSTVDGLTLANAVSLSGGARVDPGVDALTLGGVVSGTGSLIKTGSGTLVLAGVNTYAGGTSIREGVLSVASDANLGAAGVAIDFTGGVSKTLLLTADFSTDRNITLNDDARIDGGSFDVTLNGVISGPSGLSKQGTGTLTLTGSNAYGGDTLLDAGAIRVTNNLALGSGPLNAAGGTTLISGAPAITLANAVVLGGALTIDLTGTTAVTDPVTGAFTSNGSNLTLSGPIGGAGSLVTANSGTLTLAGSNGFTGGVTATTAQVLVTTADALGTGVLTLADQAGLRNNSGVTLTLANAVTLGGALNSIGGSSDLTLTGVIAGTAGFTKVGADTLTLTGTSTYSGATTVNGGTLNVNGTLTGGGATDVNDGATLAGTGSITGTVTLADGATLSPGNSPGTLAIVGDLILNPLTSVAYELGQPNVVGGAFNDRTTVTGNLTLDGLLSVTDSNAFGLGVYNLFQYGGALTDNGLSIASLPGAFTGLVQTVVPGQVNLIVTTPGAIVQYWDGTDFAGNGAIDGGTGTWNALNTNWTTDAPSVLNSNWQGGVAVFAGAAGTVTLATPQTAQGLQFTTDGYLLQGAALNFDVPAFVSTSSGVTATIESQVTGAGSMAKQGTGTLVLNGDNSYAGGTTITGGVVVVGTDTALSTGPVTITNAGLAAGADELVLANAITTTASTTVDSGSGVFTLNGNIDGAGSISQIGTGNLVLNGNNSFVNLGINLGTVTLGTDTAAGSGGIALNDGAILAAGVSGLTIANAIFTTGSGRVDSGSGVFTLSNSIGGAGSISQIGTGNLVLNGNNTFTNLGINLGRVTLGTNTAAGVGGIALNDGAILAAGVSGLTIANAIFTTGSGRVDSGPGVFTLSNSIGGAGSISQIGTGNLVLNGNNTFTNLGINVGRVTLGTNTAAGVGGIAINEGGILAAGVSGLTIANAIFTTGGGRVDSGPGVLTLSNSIGGGGSISQIGTGNLVLNGNNTFTNLGINLGTVTVGTNTAAGVGGIALNDGAILAAGVSGLVIANAITTTGSGRVDQGPGTFTLNGNIDGAGSISSIGTGNLVLNGNNSFTNLGINLGTVTVGSNTAAGIGGIALNDGAILAAGVSGLTIANAIFTTGSGRVDSGPGVFTLSNSIGGAGSISQIGTGNLVLNGNNTFTNLGINLGRVTLGTNTAAGVGGIALNDGAILAAGVSGLTIANAIFTTGSGRVDSGPGVFTLSNSIGGAGSISQIGTGNLVLNGNNTFTNLGINVGRVTLGTNTAAGVGGIAINEGGILAAGVSGLTIANAIFTTGGGRVDSGPGVFTLSNSIGGGGSISQIGTGNLVLNGNNTFTNLGINVGRVTLGTNTAAGVGGIAINEGGILAAGVSGLTIANAIVTTGGGRVDSGPGVFTLNGSIGGAGSISQIGTGNLVLNGANTFTNLGINLGTVTLGTNTAAGIGAIAINEGAILAAGVSGLTIANNIATTGGGRVNSGPGTLTLNGAISGAGSISQIGTGNLVLNGNNSYAGGLGVNLGTVTVGSNTAAGIGAIALNAATLAAGTSGLTLANAIQTTGGGSIDSGAGIFTLSGSIGNAGGITKRGSGVLILSGTSTYTGPTSVVAGRLTVTGSIAPSAVTVQSGAILSGTGTVGATNVLSGGTLAPGAALGGTGTLSVAGNLTLAAGSTYSIDIAGAAVDRVAVAGTANIAGSNLLVNPTATPLLFNTSYTILTSTGARTGTFATTSLGQFGQAFIPTVTYGANDVMIRLAPGSIAGLQGAGGTANTNAIAGALDTAVAGGFNPQNFFGLFTLNGAALTSALNQFTGEIGSANSRTALADTRYVREAAFDRLGAALRDGDAATTTTDGERSTTLWARGIGSWTDTDGDGNGAALDIEARGIIAGIDTSFGDVKVGALFNYIHTDVDTQQLGSGNVESTGGGVYVGYRPAGGLALGAGGAISSVKGETSRGIAAAGIIQSLTGDTDGTVYQLFGEVAYDLAATETVRIEPFARLAYVKYDLDGFSEAGGFAALTQQDAKYDITVSSVGVRGSTTLGGTASLRGSVGYQNIGGDRSPLSRVAFQGTSSFAGIRGVALDKSSFVGEAGVDFRIGDKASLGVGYSGVIGKNNSDNGVKATFTLGF